MEVLIGFLLGALLGCIACTQVKKAGSTSKKQGDACYWEAEPLEEQWQRLVDFEGYKSVREDEDAQS